MIRINLLPYRDERRQWQILQYILVALVSLELVGLLILSSYSWVSMGLSDAKDRFQQVQSENSALRARLGELTKFEDVQAEVQKKLDLVDKLQKGRFRSLGTMLGLSGAIPKNVWLTEVKDSGGQISISGFGESNRAIAKFMRSLEARGVFAGVDLKLIKRERVNGVPLRSFSLTMNRVDAKPVSEAAVGKPPKGKAS